MAKNLLQITADIAEKISFPLATANVIARFGRDDGLLSSGGRGRNVPRATAVDAANLIIAMLVSPTPARATKYMRDFGDLVCTHVTVAEFAEGTPLATLLPEGQTFRDGIGSLLTSLGNEQFVAAIYPTFHRWPSGGIQLPFATITIRDTTLSASIRFRGVEATYSHASLIGIGDLDVEAAKRAVLKNNEAVRRYFRGVHSLKSIDEDVIFHIAQSLNGVGFAELVGRKGWETVE